MGICKLIVNGSGSNGNNYIIEDIRGKKILLDLGVDWDIINESLNFNTYDVVGALCTHR